MRSEIRRNYSLFFPALLFFLLVIPLAAVFAAEREPVLTVEDEHVSVDEILYLLGVQSGGGEVAASLLARQMTSGEREAFLEQVTRALLFSKGAIIRGLHLDPGVAARIRWSRINALAEAYVGSMAPLLSFDEKRLRTHYEENRRNYYQQERVRVRHIFSPDEGQARTALLRLLSGEDFSKVAASMSLDFTTAEKGGEMGWLERGTLPEPLDDAVFSASPRSVQGPLKTKYGYHVFEVLERVRERFLSFEEARDAIRSEMVERVMASESASLRERFPVRSDLSLLEKELLR